MTRGLESVVLGKRRAFFDEFERSGTSGSPINNVPSSAEEFCHPSTEKAVLDLPARSSHSLLKYALLKAYETS